MTFQGVKGGKWQAWSSFSALVGGGSGKKNSSFKASMDDSYVGVRYFASI